MWAVVVALSRLNGCGRRKGAQPRLVLNPVKIDAPLTAQNALGTWHTRQLGYSGGACTRGFEGFTHPRCGFYWRGRVRGDRRILPESSATIGATGLQCGDPRIRTNIGGFIHAVWRAFNAFAMRTGRAYWQ